MSALPPTTQSPIQDIGRFSFDDMDPYKLALSLVRTLDDLLPVRAFDPSPRHPFTYFTKVDQNVPESGSLEDYLTLLSTLRATRDNITQRISVISHEFHSAQSLARIYELRITHAKNTLNVFEDVIGEVRARFSARGIPIYPLPDRQLHATCDAAPSGSSGDSTMTIESGTVEEVSIMFY
jgi:hypothetical protein